MCKEIKFIDLFGGIGGFRLGLTRCNNNGGRERGLKRANNKSNGKQQRNPAIGRGGCGVISEVTKPIQSEVRGNHFNCVAYYEINKHAVSVYNKNFGKSHNPTDIRRLKAIDIPDFDLLCAGFPCQSFSIAGKRKGLKDTRGTLFFEICRIVGDKRPALLLLENVKGLLNHDEGLTFQIILESLDELGYDVEWEVLNSKNFGVPQNRERVFIVGHLGGIGRQQVFPLGEDGKRVNETTGENKMTLFDGAGNQDVYTAIDKNYHKGFGARGNSRGRTMVMTQDRHDLRMHKTPNEVLDLKERMGLGGNNVPMVMDWSKSHRTGKSEADKRRKNYGEVEHRIKTHEFNSLNTGDECGNMSTQNFVKESKRIRRLTPTECERLQGFPDGWTSGVSDTQRYRQLGNAVTVNVIEAVGWRVKEVIEE